MNILINWIVAAIVIFAVAYILPGVTVSGFLAALIVALVLGLINAFIKPLVIFLTLPINLITLGLFTFVIDSFLIILTAWIVEGFSVASFWWALGFALILSLVNSLFKKEQRRTSSNQ